MRREKLTELLDITRASFYPDRCALCGKPIERKHFVCDKCKKSAPVITGKRCFSCGRSKKDCRCRGRANFYEGITGAFMYKDMVRRGITLWKFRGAEKSLEFFARAVAKCVENDFEDVTFDAVCFVPQTSKELKIRGYNQGETLARAVGKKLGVPTERFLIKIFETKRQHNLPHYMKSGNVFGVFDCRETEKLDGKTILLIDDIKTSGNTLNECAKMLLLRGTSKVYCAVIAIS